MINATNFENFLKFLKAVIPIACYVLEKVNVVM